LEFEVFDQLPGDWSVQTLVLSLGSLLLTIVGVFVQRRAAQAVMLVARSLFVGIIAYSFGTNIYVPLLLLTTLVVDANSRIPGFGGSLLSVCAFFFVLAFSFLAMGRLGGFWTVVWLSAPAAFITLSITVISYQLWTKMLLGHRQRATIDNLNVVVQQLGKANQALQDGAFRSASEERRRITRDIHDIMGHGLMNLKMLMEVATRLTQPENVELQDIHNQARMIAQRAAREVRQSLYQLRTSNQHHVSGLWAIFRLSKDFKQATGVQVRIEYGNAKFSYGDQVDAALYRLVQEGLTNALLHGHATEVFISFWVKNGWLEVSLEDNGRFNYGNASDGIGNQGINERVEELGGTVVRSFTVLGFRLSVSIPVSNEEQSEIQLAGSKK